jgi:hypothetical protein
LADKKQPASSSGFDLLPKSQKMTLKIYKHELGKDLNADFE